MSMNDNDPDPFRIAPAIAERPVQRAADVGDAFLVHGNDQGNVTGRIDGGTAIGGVNPDSTNDRFGKFHELRPQPS